MSFTWPLALLLFALLPLAVLGYLLAQRRRAKYAVRFTNLDLLASVVDRAPNWRRHLPALLYLVAIAALIVALARPNVVTSSPREQATVVLVTDISGSMNATDVDPTRLLAAEKAADILLDKLPKGFRVSLVSFSNGVNILVPPTDDKDQVRAALDTLHANGGTAMGDAIVQAVDVARPLPQADNNGAPGATPAASPTPTPTPVPSNNGSGGPPPAVIVLLSDGANSTGQAQPLDAAQVAKDRGVPIFTVALGTPDGVVDVIDNTGRRRRIAVPPDPETLQQVADITGGKFFDAPSAGDLQQVYNDLGSKIGFIDEEHEITYWFAGAAAALVVLAGGLGLWWFNRFP